MAKKQKIRKREEARLYQLIDRQKQKYFRQKSLLERSIDPSEDVRLQLKMEEAKYRFLLREARLLNERTKL
ncbi:YaaL family protein [Salicibibacter cibarius]|uniref:YaaL family protein n=1 Tax=Salicibibacter cibarius TaxID=2743000 RepID=A0A7T6YZP8_9BACI|nr:YaaL family protein [Salicibibacter cibarius]QQK74242.1 YaaL family protein [Salicibibacter cibarius]